MTVIRRRGLRTAVLDDTLLLGGSVPPARLRGTAATTLVPALLAAADGVRDVPRIAEAIGTPERHVEAVLSLLARHGAVETAAAAREPDSTEAGFFALVAGHRADPRSGEALRAVFARTAVEVVGDDAFAAIVRAGSSTRERHHPSGGSLVIGSDAGKLTKRWHAGAVVLPVRATGTELVIGPVTHLGTNPCPHCLIEGTSEPGSLPAAHHGLAAALVAARIPVLATVGHDDVTWSQAQHLDLESGRTRLVARASRPGCPSCSVLIDSAPSRASAASRYEAALGPVTPAPSTPAPLVEWPLARRVPAEGLAAEVQRAWSGNTVASMHCHLLLPDGENQGVFGVLRDEPELAVLSTAPMSPPGLVVLTGALAAAASWSGGAALHELLVEAGWAIERIRTCLGGRGKVLDAWPDGDISRLLNVDPAAEPVLAVLAIGDAS
ncbi:hypothetical protein [Allokutzneria oryzae]|uniref:TOMM leader peptide-binding protein n=1 Tax=Allokutzneria oryzae TaxID=1378989 RepID=A0ABV5ZVM3_9PSEU